MHENTNLVDTTTDRVAPRVAHLAGTPACSTKARWGLTWFVLKGEGFAADAVELMGVNPQMVRGACDQICHLNGGLLFHRYNFHRLVALKTQERGADHTPGGAVWPSFHSQRLTVLTSKRSRHHDALQGDGFSQSESRK